MTRWVKATKERVKTMVLRRVSCGSEKEVVSLHLATSSCNKIIGSEFRGHLMKGLMVLLAKQYKTKKRLVISRLPQRPSKESLILRQAGHSTTVRSEELTDWAPLMGKVVDQEEHFLSFYTRLQYRICLQ